LRESADRTPTDGKETGVIEATKRWIAINAPVKSKTQSDVDQLPVTEDDTAELDVNDAKWDRAELWALGAKDMRPEPITLTDMGVEEDDQASVVGIKDSASKAATVAPTARTYQARRLPVPRLPTLEEIGKLVIWVIGFALYGIQMLTKFVTAKVKACRRQG
jgi:hypothetical protein